MEWAAVIREWIKAMRAMKGREEWSMTYDWSHGRGPGCEMHTPDFKDLV
jgi:hypothetical protein